MDIFFRVLRMYKNLLTQVKRDKKIKKYSVHFREDEKLRSFTAEKQSNKTSNHVKYLSVYVCVHITTCYCIQII